MYVLILLVLLACGARAFLTGMRRRSRAHFIRSGMWVGGAVLFFGALDFWVEMLWFDAVGYRGRFWTVVWTRVMTVTAGVLAGGSIPYLVARSLPASRTRAFPLALASSLVGGAIGWAAWDDVLLFLNRVSTGTSEPFLGLDVSFYLFVLPLLDRLFDLFLVLAGSSLLATLVGIQVVGDRGRFSLARLAEPESQTALSRLSALLGIVIALGLGLAVFHLLYSKWGVVAGPGWTDVHVRYPAYGIVAVVALVLGAVPALRRPREPRTRARTLAFSWATIGATAFLGLFVAPHLVQWIVVEPNEITFEKPYIARNIDFTRRGFRLHDVEERSFPATASFTAETMARNEELLSEVRLWDYRALESVYRQFQEIRLYYEFPDVDLDRYRIEDRTRLVMVSAREMQQKNLPPQSQTFVNQRFKYTHGYGLTLATVSGFTSAGLPDLLVKDIPPRADLPELAVRRPEIYYGDLTSEPAVVNTTELEFDYPSGDENVYARYEGGGGVLLETLWRKFAFGWRLDGTRFLFSGYPTPDTRIMLHRQVRERVSTLAPFLEFDEDPYVVLADGRLFWIVDGYTTSRSYPYSEPFSSRERIEVSHEGRRDENDGVIASIIDGNLDGANYARNSVKAVVDAYEGTVDFYVFEEDDPLVRAWSAAFPGLFQSKEEMPSELRAHVRYPVDFLLAQGIVYAKYHMTDPEVFYNQEDLWMRATEKYYSSLQPVEPYYVMWSLPGAEEPEFVLILPFTPKNRQVLIGWIAGLCDGDNYGRFLAYKFPKEKRVLGPQQVETKIDQDPFLSGQLTLWDQRGSSVIRGNVLAFPIEDGLLYVEPIYLQAESAAYPELRLVVVMQGDRMSYASTFEEALRGLCEAAPVPLADVSGAAPDAPLNELVKSANRAFEAYLEAMGEQSFPAAANELARLQTLLESLSRATAKNVRD